jgi:hypothetical protein
VLWYMPVISAILEAEAGGSRVWGQPGLQSKNLTQKKKKNIYIYIYIHPHLCIYVRFTC